MDALQEFVEMNQLSIPAILKYVDDYSIFSFYIGVELELHTKYSSPLRLKDEDPSFSLYYSNKTGLEDRIFFKDHATGKSGDVFVFLRELLGDGFHRTSVRQVLLQVNSDFGLGLNGEDVGEFKPHLVKKAPLRKEHAKMEVTLHDEPTQEFLDYWDTLGISAETRKRYYCSNARLIHYITEDYHKTIVPKNLCISYEIVGHYKSYQPFAEKQYKFRNNYLDIFVEGALQLKFEKDFAIITKASKECMFFAEHFDWETVAGKSENTPINPYFMEETLHKKYKTVFIWLDNDEAGRNAQARYVEAYPWLVPIIMDDFIPQKDPTDLYDSAKKVGVQKQALAYMKNLIESKL